METKVFPQMNTMVRICERTLLSQAQKLELSHSIDIETTLKNLGAIGFFVYAKPSDNKGFFSTLELEKQSWIEWCRNISPEREITRFFELPDILQNLKVFVRELVLEEELSHLYLPIPSYKKEYFTKIYHAEEKELSEDEKRMKQVIGQTVLDYSIYQSFSFNDLTIDFYGYKECLSISDNLENKDIKNFILSYVDMRILSTLLQLKEVDSVYNQVLARRAVAGFLNANVQKLFSASFQERDTFLKTTVYSELWIQLREKGEVDLFDVYADNYLLGMCRKAKLEAFGVFPLFTFMYAKLLDIKNVRGLFALKLEGIGEEKISERLRAGYEL